MTVTSQNKPAPAKAGKTRGKNLPTGDSCGGSDTISGQVPSGPRLAVPLPPAADAGLEHLRQTFLPAAAAAAARTGAQGERERRLGTAGTHTTSARRGAPVPCVRARSRSWGCRRPLTRLPGACTYACACMLTRPFVHGHPPPCMHRACLLRRAGGRLRAAVRGNRPRRATRPTKLPTRAPAAIARRSVPSPPPPLGASCAAVHPAAATGVAVAPGMRWMV